MIVYVLKLDNYKVSARYCGGTIKYQYNKFFMLSTDNIDFYVVAEVELNHRHTDFQSVSC